MVDETKTYAKIAKWFKSLSKTQSLYALNDFAYEFAYHSAKVERADISYDEALEVYDHDSVTNYSGDVRSLVSIMNQRSAFWWMVEKILAGAPLDEHFILTLHRAHLPHALKSPASRRRASRQIQAGRLLRARDEEVGAPLPIVLA